MSRLRVEATKILRVRHSIFTELAFYSSISKFRASKPELKRNVYFVVAGMKPDDDSAQKVSESDKEELKQGDEEKVTSKLMKLISEHAHTGEGKE